jgi:hypothetical protein
MYRIYADDTLIYDSTLEDYKIGKGQITKEADKSGSFVFSVYPDHPYYGQFIQMRTLITVYKSGRIVFRGRILDDAVDYWNVKTLTCEGELGFLQDSVARPFSFQGDHADLFARFIAEHNEQVDEWKRFKVGTVTVVDENEYINRSAGGYGAMLDTMQSSLTESALGGHFYITHGDDGTDPVPTLHYVADFPKTASQGIEFGVNLKDYTKKVSATDLATCIIPLGTSNGSDGERLTIEDVNGGKDYIYDQNAVTLYGWIVKTVVWEDVTLANHLLTKGRAWLSEVVNAHATIELNAIDLHLLDRSIESYNVCEYVRATSAPHGLDALMLCSKQTMDLLKPDNDTVTLGYSYGTLTGANVQLGASVSTMGKKMSSIAQDAESIRMEVQDLETKYSSSIELTANELRAEIQGLEDEYAAFRLTVEGFWVDGPNGSTLIAGSMIDTSTLRVDNIEVDLTGSIKWGDFSTGLQDEIDSIYDLAAEAWDMADAMSLPSYIKNTYIDAVTIKSPTIEANDIGLYGGYFDVYDSSGTIHYGSMGYGSGLTSTGETTLGVVMSAAGNTDLGEEGNYFIATNKGVRMQSGASKVFAVDGSAYLESNGNSVYVSETGAYTKVNGVVSVIGGCKMMLAAEYDAVTDWSTVLREGETAWRCEYVTT